MRTVSVLGSLALSLVASLTVAAAQKQPFTAERSWELQRIAAPTISPDGKWTVVSISKPDIKENKLWSDLWLYSTDGRIERRLTSHASGDSAPLFSPDGSRVAFIAQRDDDKTAQRLAATRFEVRPAWTDLLTSRSSRIDRVRPRSNAGAGAIREPHQTSNLELLAVVWVRRAECKRDRFRLIQKPDS